MSSRGPCPLRSGQKKPEWPLAGPAWGDVDSTAGALSLQRKADVPRRSERSASPACPLCGSVRLRDRIPESRLLALSPDCVIRFCRDCGLGVREPRPGTAILDVYDETYYQDYGVLEQQTPVYLLDALTEVERVAGRGRLLEVGCGLGGFLRDAQKRGWCVVGLEGSGWAARFTARERGIPVALSLADALPFPDRRFDVVVCHHVLEHLPDPLGALRECRRVCQPSGRLLLHLPNELGHLFIRFALPEALVPGGQGPWASLRRWLAYQTPNPVRESTHLFFFSPRALSRALRATGWQLVRLRTVRSLRDTASGYPGGGVFKRALYRLEGALNRGPEIEAVAAPAP